MQRNISKKKHVTVPPQFHSLEDATGMIDYRFTNDYMFRAILQENTAVLTALVCSLLHLKPSEVTSVVITNPIKLGEHIDDKDFILDIAILLNHNVSINLDYSDFRFIPINLLKDRFHKTSKQFYRNNYFNNLVQAG